MKTIQNDKETESAMSIEADLSALKYKIKGFSFMFGSMDLHCAPGPNEIAGLGDIISGFGDEIALICERLVKMQKERDLI